MKKFLLSMAAGAMALTATAAPVFAAESSTGTTNVGYTDGAITDPDNPTSPSFSVSIPKDFMFVKDTNETQNMTVKLNVIKTGDLAGKKVKVEVASKNGYSLLNDTVSPADALDYTLNYGGSYATVNGKEVYSGGTVLNDDTTVQLVGNLEDVDGKREISGQAVLPHDQLTEVGVDGTYTDILTYTVHGVTVK